MSKQNLWDQEYKKLDIASSFKGTLSRSITFLRDFLEKNGGALTGLKILDCGCGNGRNAIPLAQMGNRVVIAMDSSHEALKSLSETMRGMENISDRLHVVEASMAGPLPFSPDTFDVICDITSFDNLLTEEGRETHRHEVWRTLKPNGYFLYYDMDASDPYSLWLKAEGRIRDDDVLVSPEPTPIPFKVWSLEEVQEIFWSFDLVASDLFRFKDMMYGREHDRAILCALFKPKK